LAFQVGDAEHLPFQDASFDAVLINFGILHFPNPDKALAEAERVLKTGGRLAFTAWAGPDGSAVGIAMNAIAREGSLDVDLPAGPPLFRFADHAECNRTLSKIGFEEIHTRDLLLTWSLPRHDALMSSFQQATARTSGLLAAQDPKLLPAIEEAMTEGCQPFRNGESADLPMPAVLTVGTKT
jgi:SAM-dependent methyltransferase